MRYTKSGRLNMPTARLLALPSLFAVTLALASPAVAASLSPALTIFRCGGYGRGGR